LICAFRVIQDYGTGAQAILGGWNRRTGAKNIWMVEPEPESWVTVPQTKFVGQADCTNKKFSVFSSQWTKLFRSRSQKI